MTVFPSSYENDLRTAEEVWLVGVSLKNTVRTYHKTFKKKLENGHKLKVLLAKQQIFQVHFLMLTKPSLKNTVCLLLKFPTSHLSLTYLLLLQQLVVQLKLDSTILLTII